MPSFAKRNIESWKKFLPGFEIIKIDETNFDLKQNKYLIEASKAKYWGNVSDYVRLKWIYDHGGVYFDLDVELIKDMTPIIEKGAFFGFDGNDKAGYLIATGLGFAAEKGNPLLKEMLKPYDMWDEPSFISNKGFPIAPTCPIMDWPAFENWGLVPNNIMQTIKGITFYPNTYFSPKDYLTREIYLSDDTYSIHHYSGGNNRKIDLWMNKYRSKQRKKHGLDYIDTKKYKICLCLLHPIRFLIYHLTHKERK